MTQSHLNGDKPVAGLSGCPLPGFGNKIEGPCHKGGHLPTSNRLLRAVTGRIRRTTGGDTRSRQSVDPGRVGIVLGVRETRSRPRFETERPGEEAGHLSPSHDLVRAITRRVNSTTLGDTELSKTPDVGRPPPATIDIRKPRGQTLRRGIVVKNPGKPYRHDPAAQALARTNQPLPTLRPFENTHPSESLDRRLMDTSIIVTETADLCTHRCRSVHPPLQPTP